MRQYRIIVSRFVALACVVWWAGCATTPQPFVPSQATSASWRSTREVKAEEELNISVAVLRTTTCPVAAKQVFEDLLRKASQAPIQERARILGEVGVNSLHNGDVDDARMALDDALSVMGGTITDPQMQQYVLSLSGAEQAKIFKGESHERAMCYLYRALIYMADGEFDNARAALKSAEIQDVRAVGGQAAAGDWLSVRYLKSLSHRADKTEDETPYTTSIPEGLSAGEVRDGDDTVLIIASGYAPRKVVNKERGTYGLSYRPVPSKARGVVIRPTTNGSETATTPATSEVALKNPTEDLFVQAMSRGRRDMDKVLEAKKQQADTARGVAGVSEVVGVTAAQFGVYGLPVTLLSALVSTSEKDKAARAETLADLRQITSLPGSLYMATYRSSQSPIRIEATDENGAPICAKEFTVPQPQAGRMNVVLIRVHK